MIWMRKLKTHCVGGPRVSSYGLTSGLSEFLKRPEYGQRIKNDRLAPGKGTCPDQGPKHQQVARCFHWS